ncbi:XRE family transcriptional regulator [Enterobacter sp. RIT418]|uniref:XRE family transcriptional regulator n=1 Tax=Enterobacter sp. RIT418 TaxID=2202164 RepID=UPI000D4BB2CF|nr:XRE family transcriptional regulator [Enterobacter sp. RIT 418]RAU37088.1 XRE family transcriptional regulator [Enterobacter sp. RIT 418]
MPLIENYTPPAPEDLARLKDELGLTGNQMADLAGLAGSNHWRKYTGGESPRVMGLHMLFYMAAQLELKPEELQKVLKKMIEIGASLES